MINTFKTRLTLVAAVMAVAAFAPQAANAQTESITATVAVQNTLTTNVVDHLNFGIVAAVSDDTETATLAINPTTGVLTPTTTGAPALFASIDDALAMPALLTVEDAAEAALINIVINNVTNPTFGGSSFTLNGFQTSWNGTASAPRTAGTGWTQTFSQAFGSGINTLAIGASIVTQASVASYGDGTYTGGFDVVFSY